MGINISLANSNSTSVWVAPSDWIQLGTPANNEILLLASDIVQTYSFRILCIGGYTVDWGDGVITNYSHDSDCSHTYTVGAGQVCSKGYTTFKIRIYAQVPANNITRFYINPVFPNPYNGLLWVKFGTTGLTTLASAFANSINGFWQYSSYLEAVSLPSSLISCTSFSYTFSGCYSLKKIDLPTNYYSGNIAFDNIFVNCISITNVNFNVSSLNISSLTSAFSGCINLLSITLPATVNNCTSFAATFFNCYSLRSISLPDINTNTNCGQTFTNVNSLKELIFPNSWNGRINYFYQGIISSSIEKLILPATITAPMYIGILCSKIKTLAFPSIASGSWDSFTQDYNMVYNCFNLETVTNFPAIRNTYNASPGIVRNNYKLKSIDNINEIGTLKSGGISLDITGNYALTTLAPKAMFSGRFLLSGLNAVNIAALSSLIFSNPTATSTWAGTSPQIDIAYCSMSAEALNACFTSIIATSVSFSGKTIRITGNPGAATCDTTIITNVGGTINKTT